MAYVTVPKDLTKIKSKMLFGLTKRQLVCFGSAALVGVPLFFLSKGSMGTTPAALCMILVMLPFFLFALYEKNGQTPEALLGNLIQCKFIRPKKRVYQTNNAYSALEKQADLERTVGRIATGAGKRGKGRRRLTRHERKQIEAVIRQAKGDGKNHTVQASLPFRNMHPDGLCRLDDRHFSKTIAYADVSYRLAGPDDQRDIFERLCDFYNGYDPSIGVQMTLSSSHKAGGGDLFRMAAQGDELDGIRAEASGILQTQYERGSNGYVKSKYVTLTIEAESIQVARARFSRIEADTLNRFKVMGAAAKVLDGKERLALLHGLLHPRGEPFAFEWDWLAPSGLSVKDFIAPSSFEFGETRRFRMGEMYGAVSFLQILAPEIQDRILTDFMDVEGNLLVTMHVRGINQNEAIKMVKRKITDLDAMKIQEQKKAARSGYDLDILPSDLSTYGGAAKNLLQDLQSRNERLFNTMCIRDSIIADELAHLFSAGPNLTARRIVVAELFLRSDLVFQRTPLESVGDRGQRAAFQTFILQGQPPAVPCGLIDPCDLRHTVILQPAIHDIQIGVGMGMLAARIRKQDQVNGDTVLMQSNKKGGAVRTAAIGNNIDILISINHTAVCRRRKSAAASSLY